MDLLRTENRHFYVPRIPSIRFPNFKNYNMLRKLSAIFTSAILLNAMVADAQTKVKTSALPFLTISPDSRAAALGDAGVASTPDGNSVFWNSAKLAFIDKNVGLNVSYVPWLRELTNDMFLANVSGFKKLAKNQSVGFTMGYFNPGVIEFRTAQGTAAGDFQSREFTMSGSYARKLTRSFSMGINLRYTHSNLIGDYVVNGQASKAANPISGDISTYYIRNMGTKERGTDLAFGAVISNIGGKVSYGREAYFLPTNLKIGTNIGRRLDEHNKLNFLLDFNKLLVPATDPANASKTLGMGSIQGVFNSFSGGGQLRDIAASTGLEYWYNDLFAARVGYMYETAGRGDRRYFTGGIGVKLKDSYGIDLAYLVPTTTGNPLQNTWRLSLVFDLEKRAINNPTDALDTQ